MSDNRLENIQINILFDSRHPDGDSLLVEELQQQQIRDYRIRPAITDRKTVIESINASHKMIVQQAQANNLPMIAIFEQDIQFSRPGAWTHFLKEMPESFDLYFGGTYAPIDINNGRIWCPVGLHCYIIAQKFYSTFLRVNTTTHIDTTLEGLGDFRTCFPMIALQRPGYSFNNRRVENYNINIPKEHIW